MSEDPRDEKSCAAFGNWYNENCFVIVAKKPDRLRVFLESMGLSFEREKHRNGPIHWSSVVDGKVLEIYPSRPKHTEP